MSLGSTRVNGAITTDLNETNSKPQNDLIGVILSTLPDQDANAETTRIEHGQSTDASRFIPVNSGLEMRKSEKKVTLIELDVPLGSQHGEEKKAWGEIMTLYGKGLLKAPQPTTVFGISEMEKLLRIRQTYGQVNPHTWVQ